MKDSLRLQFWKRATNFPAQVRTAHYFSQVLRGCGHGPRLIQYMHDTNFQLGISEYTVAVDFGNKENGIITRLQTLMLKHRNLAQHSVKVLFEVTY